MHEDCGGGGARLVLARVPGGGGGVLTCFLPYYGDPLLAG